MRHRAWKSAAPALQAAGRIRQARARTRVSAANVHVSTSTGTLGRHLQGFDNQNSWHPGIHLDLGMAGPGRRESSFAMHVELQNQPGSRTHGLLVRCAMLGQDWCKGRPHLGPGALRQGLSLVWWQRGSGKRVHNTVPSEKELEQVRSATVGVCHRLLKHGCRVGSAPQRSHRTPNVALQHTVPVDNNELTCTWV